MNKILNALGRFLVVFFTLVFSCALALFISLVLPVVALDLNGDMVDFVTGMLAIVSCVGSFVIAIFVAGDPYFE